jgi:protein-S-isoprenylcysteine O-methyltransferase Ste14
MREAVAAGGEPASRRAITGRGLRVAGGNVALALLSGAFAYAHVLSFVARPRLSVALAVGFELVIAVLAVVRDDAGATSTTPWAWATTLAGTYGVLLMRPMEGATDAAIGTALQVCGTAGAVLGALALNRSFGLLPAYRGIKTAGAYRIVRHPLYAAYLLGNVGYVINHPTGRNAAVVALGTAAQVARILNEERLLSQHAEYAAYRRKTRWRLVPFVF